MRYACTAAVLSLLAAVGASASGRNHCEVWGIDQSNSPGKAYGGTVYIWDGHALEHARGAPEAAAARVDLGGAAASFCFERTGANPVRPHMIAINASQSHAIISFVGSGHVLFLDAGTREPVECIRASEGEGGARQVHMATPLPDETYVTFANQNGKLFERILTDYATNTFVHDVGSTINLATCTTPNGLPCQDAAIRPDNAPICPITESSSRFTFVTLRGGGLFVVDSQSSPMAIAGEYDQQTIHGNGCLGAEAGATMYSDSGGGPRRTCTRPTSTPCRWTATRR